MKPSILVMFSGGLDSTGMLWKLIHSDAPLHIHHMNLINREKRALAESKSVSKILDCVSKIKEFGYSESTHKYPSFENRIMWDSDIVAFVAGSICLSMPFIKHIAIGMTSTDLNNQTLSNRIVRSQKILDAFTTATKIYPVKDMTKKEIWESLPDEIKELTWSCRTPRYKDGIPLRCNRCNTCKELEKL